MMFLVMITHNWAAFYSLTEGEESRNLQRLRSSGPFRTREDLRSPILTRTSIRWRRFLDSDEICCIWSEVSERVFFCYTVYEWTYIYFCLLPVINHSFSFNTASDILSFVSRITTHKIFEHFGNWYFWRLRGSNDSILRLFRDYNL